MHTEYDPLNCLNLDSYLLRLYQDNLFYTNVSLGTPPQSFEVEFRTVGNECWVPIGALQDCGPAPFLCRGSGGYNKSLSTSMKDLHSNFTVSKSIEPNLNIMGEFITDTLVIGNTTVDSMKIGILDVDATQSQSTPLLRNPILQLANESTDILGLGYGEANSSFISLTEALIGAGTIASPAFSMYVENPIIPSTRHTEPGERGTILFGGVNKSKYKGTLHSLPIVENAAGNRKAFRVNMTGFSINGTLISPQKLPTPALFNPSRSYFYVPEFIAGTIYSKLGVTEIPMTGPASIPCNTIFSNTTFTFEFGAAKLTLDSSLFIERHSVFDSEDVCTLGVISSSDSSVILGTNFLQHVYAVYDMGKEEVSLAERNWNSTEDDIFEITSGKDTDNTDGAEAKDESEDKKSAGSHISKSTVPQLSLYLFGIWAFIF